MPRLAVRSRFNLGFVPVRITVLTVGDVETMLTDHFIRCLEENKSRPIVEALRYS